MDAVPADDFRRPSLAWPSRLRHQLLVLLAGVMLVAMAAMYAVSSRRVADSALQASAQWATALARTAATKAAAGPVIAVLASYGLEGEGAFYAALEFWSAMHGFVLLEMTGVMDDIDTDGVYADMVLRLAAGLDRRR